MAGQDRGDDAEPTRRDGAQDVPDNDPTAPLSDKSSGGVPAPGGVSPDQPVDADRESAPAQPPGTQPSSGTSPAAEPGPAGPAAPPAGPPRPPTGPSGTAVLPPAPGGPPSEPPRWAARAQVPTPRVEEYPEEWVAAEPSRGVLVPVLVTLCIMLLFGVLGVGVWLIVSNQPDPGPTSPTTPATTVPTTTTTTATTPTTTTTSPTPGPIQVPPLTGETYEDAARALTELGLVPEREDVASDAVPPGHVVGTSPTAGIRVSPGDTIIVFVARETQPTATPTPTETASPSPSAT